MAYDKKEILDNFDRGVAHRVEYEQEWSDLLALYKQELEVAQGDWHSQAFVPVSQTIVEKLTAKTILTLFKGKVFQVTGRYEGDVEKAKLLDRVVAWGIDRLDHWKMTWQRYQRQKYILGTSVMKMFWDGEKPDIETVDAYNFAIEPGAISIDGAAWCAHELLKDKEYILSQLNDPESVYKLPEGVTIEMVKQDKGEQIYKTPYQGWETNTEVDTDGHVDYEKKCHLIEYWTNDKVCTILNKKWLIREGENPYGFKPFVSSCAIPRMNSFWGHGPLVPVQESQRYLNMVRNMKLDSARLQMNPPTFESYRANIEGSRLRELRPGQRIKCNDQNAFREMQFADVTGMLNGLEEMISREMQTATSISDYNLGQQSAAMNDTASGVSSLIQEANERIGLYIDSDEQMLKQFADKYIKIMKKYVTEAVSVRVTGATGKTWVEVTPEDMAARYDIVIKTPSQITNKQAYAQMVLQLYQVLSKNPHIDLYALTQRLVEAFEMPNPEELLLLPEEQVAKNVEQGKVQISTQAAIKMEQMAVAQKMASQFGPPPMMGGGMPQGGQNGEEMQAQAQMTGQMTQPDASMNQSAPDMSVTPPGGGENVQ